MLDDDETELIDRIKGWLPLICLVLTGLGWMGQQVWAYRKDRPNVSVTGTRIECSGTTCNYKTVHLLMENFGKEPARGITYRVRQSIGPIVDHKTQAEMLSQVLSDLWQYPSSPLAELASGKTWEPRLADDIDSKPLEEGHRYVAGYISWRDQLSFKKEVQFCLMEPETSKLILQAQPVWVSCDAQVSQEAFTPLNP